ncbi:MAG TPA: hypothetical protein VLM05_05555 [Mycobacteriales bacterium]|nr:hypothetical protein [Mycobacteriales bacterium]
MSPALEEDLRDALRAYAADVSAPDLTGAVQQGAARRRRRHRIALVAAPVLTVAVVATAVTMVPRWTYEPQDLAAATASLSAADRDLLTRPTGGDLAADTAFVAEAAKAWARSHRSSDNADRGIFDHLLGSPHVVWAGNTPAGRAAVVVQLSDLREHDNVQLTREGVAVLWGFAGPGAGGRPVVVADGYPVPGAPDLEGAFIDPGRTVVLAIDKGNAGEEVSWGLSFSRTEKVSRRWSPVRWDDGAAVLTAPAGTRPAEARLRFRGGDAEIGNTTDDPAADAQDPGDSRQQWQVPDNWAVFPVGIDPAAAWRGPLPDGYGVQHVFDGDLAGWYPTTWPDVQQSASSLWYAAGTTPDGSRLVAGEVLLDRYPPRVYAALRIPGKAARIVSGPTYRDQAVPIRLELPDGQGRLVAAKGKTFAWTEGGVARTARDAALIPAGTTAVTADGTPVPLP